MVQHFIDETLNTLLLYITQLSNYELSFLRNSQII